MTNANLAALSAAGVSIWLDDLSKDLIDSGTLSEYVDNLGVVGVTTNPAIFKAAIAESATYDEPIAVARAAGQEAGLSGDELVDSVVRDLTTNDVRAACDVLAPVYECSRYTDGRVSLEVDPRLAHDTEATVSQAISLAHAVDRPNVMIKIPATDAGLPAISRVLAEGIDVNVTLIFSAAQYAKVAQAYISGVAAAHANGHDVSRLRSVASVFVSRLDTNIDEQLPAESPLAGKAGLAGARLCQVEYDKAFSSSDWAELREIGAEPQRLLWASTGVKNPAYPDTLYVTGLVTRGTVNTMPLATIKAFAEHGDITGDTVRNTGEESAAHFAALADAGIDIDATFRTLEQEGVDKFVTAWAQLSRAVSARI